MDHVCTLNIDPGNGHPRRRYEFHRTGNIIEERGTSAGDAILSRYMHIGGADMMTITRLLSRANGRTFKTDATYGRIASKLAVSCRLHLMGTTPLYQVDSADRVVSIISDDDSADTLHETCKMFKIGMGGA